jgi:hypothetical protein
MIKQTYPKYAKNSDLSRGCTDTAARVRSGSQGDGGQENKQGGNNLKPNESMHLKSVRRKG